VAQRQADVLQGGGLLAGVGEADVVEADARLALQVTLRGMRP
jgi:hypothetical protein